MPQARLIRHLDAQECAQRNALTQKAAGLALPAGTIGTLVDTFGNGDAYLVEFGSHGPEQCDWLGVLYASELHLMSEVAEAA